MRPMRHTSEPGSKVGVPLQPEPLNNQLRPAARSPVVPSLRSRTRLDQVRASRVQGSSVNLPDNVAGYQGGRQAACGPCPAALLAREPARKSSRPGIGIERVADAAPIRQLQQHIQGKGARGPLSCRRAPCSPCDTLPLPAPQPHTRWRCGTTRSWCLRPWPRTRARHAP